VPLGHPGTRPSINVVADERVPIFAGTDVVRHASVVQLDRAFSDALLFELALLAKLDLPQCLTHARHCGKAWGCGAKFGSTSASRFDEISGRRLAVTTEVEVELTVERTGHAAHLVGYRHSQDWINPFSHVPRTFRAEQPWTAATRSESPARFGDYRPGDQA
jgi:hypothetical protein